jgi:hypothetical protein
MALGEIPGGNLRAYYKLENENDSSGNGLTLTNNNSVTFGPAKFSNGADFGSSGTDKGLTYGANILSSEVVTNLFISFWMKLNSTSNFTGRKNPIVLSTKTSGTDGTIFAIDYEISGGNLSIVGRRNIQPSGSAIVTLNCGAVNSNWNYFTYQREGNAQRLSFNRSIFASASNAATDRSNTFNPTIFLSIGNDRALSSQVFAQIDEVIISEQLYTEADATDKSQRMKYYTQSKGRFCI